MIDDRDSKFNLKDESFIKFLCERKYGIGGDGLIVLKDHEEYDFEMIFFNSTGERSTFCGNGGRCIVAFAGHLGIVSEDCEFIAYDGLHLGRIKSDNISLQMRDVNQVVSEDNEIILDTGSPHLVKMVDVLSDVDVLKEGKRLSSLAKFGDYGINVNFVEQKKDIHIRTYERGDEMESFSCGTGSVATAIALHKIGLINDTKICVNTKGGVLYVSFIYNKGSYRDIWLEGQVSLVYSGSFIC